MPSLPSIVLADDLTGAAEVAAIAHQAGLRAVVLTQLPTGPIDADVMVFDTDTRLASRTELARRVRSAITRLRRRPHAGFFLKVDSVLRGPVSAQLAAYARALGRSRTLLVPANPSLGRTIRHGRYFIDDRPLHETAFRHDPHHPRNTDEVQRLLGDARQTVTVCRVGVRRLPREGVVVGEAATAADVTHWAQRLDDKTLPAGGADFFRAWIESGGREPHPVPRYSLPEGNALLFHGTTVGSVKGRTLFFRGTRAPSSASVIAALKRDGAAAVAAAPTILRDPGAPAAISEGFASLAARLHRADAFRHLLIAGGATAATVLRTLGWSSLRVVRVWASGVVTLQPDAAPDLAVTLKPGSYPWPANLRPVLLDFTLS